VTQTSRPNQQKCHMCKGKPIVSGQRWEATE